MHGREVEDCVRRALDMLYARDAGLLRDGAAEWSVAHRLAVYIEDEFPGWNVDCEFNRQGPNGNVKRRATGEGVRPDIIVHHRGRPEAEHNLLAVELKTTASGQDAGKVREYTEPPSEDRSFQYQFGLTVVLDGAPALRWFAGGEESGTSC